MTDASGQLDDPGRVYAMFWRLMELCVHRYGSFPTGQLLMVLTVVLLDRAGYHPTIGELVRITRLPKSTVSRYVSAEMASGFLEEVIDPDDRRRRRLRPTDKAREEQDWHQEKVREIAEQTMRVMSGRGDTMRPGEDLKQILLDIGRESDRAI